MGIETVMRPRSSHAERVLLVEDDRSLRELLTDELVDAGLDVRSVAAFEAARREIVVWMPELVISDLRLPGADGLVLLRFVNEMAAPPAFIIITAFGTIEQAVDALKEGADEFLTKPLDLDHFIVCVRRTLETRQLRREVQRFKTLLGNDDFHGMLGRSQIMQTLFASLSRVAHAGGPVLIIGESGVGKELVARAVHEESERSAAPFVAVNCAGIPAELLESEFFGHAAGAFTGAQKSRRGLFAEAGGGSILLDEIGEMPMALQAKLLRVLQDGVVRPLGSNREESLDVRIIASTNRDLGADVEAGRFREDLFYRLETFTLNVPPLRERGDDVDMLVAYFIRKFCSRRGRAPPGISEAALRRLKRYAFPGNVRELQNAIERAVTFCDTQAIEPRHLPDRLRHADIDHAEMMQAPPFVNDALLTLEEVEQRYILHVLERVHGNKKKAAALLGIGRRTLYRRLNPSAPDDSESGERGAASD